MPLLETLPESLTRLFSETHSRFSAEHPFLLPEPPPDSPAQEGEGVALVETPRATEPQNYDRVIFETDVNQAGQFAPEWLILEAHYAYVYTEKDGKPHHVTSVYLPDVVKAKAEIFFGNGTLELRTKTATLSLLRFSQANIAEANQVARQITARAKNDPPPQESKDAQKNGVRVAAASCRQIARSAPPV